MGKELNQSEIDSLTRLISGIDKTCLSTAVEIKVVAADMSFNIICTPKKTQPLDLPPFMKKYTPEGGGKWQ